MAKIENGNIQAEIRIVTTDDQPAEDNIQTLQGLRERHPCAAINKQPLPDPTTSSAANFADDDIIVADLRSFQQVRRAAHTESGISTFTTLCLTERPAPH
jgi:hypothetical protein